MPRQARINPGGIVYHVLNRAARRKRIFRYPADYRAFETCLAETREMKKMRILAHCIMPNHWHLVLRPGHDGALGPFMQRLTITHVRRWKEPHDEVGLGPLYQGRYKPIPVRSDEHLLVLIRWVEANALHAGLVNRAEDWPWSTASSRYGKHGNPTVLSGWPVPKPSNWHAWVNESWEPIQLKRIRECVQKNRPFGPNAWANETAKKLGIESSLRARGRPRKNETVPF